VFLEDGGTFHEATDVIPSYIKFCTDVCLETKEVKLFPNTKPWVTKELKLMLRDRHKAFKENNKQKMKEIQKKIDKKIKNDKKRYASKVEENFQHNNSRLFWKNIETITGYKQKKKGLQADDEEQLANNLNVFYTHFDRCDFHTQQAQAMEKLRHLPAQPFVISEEDVRLDFRKVNSRSAAGPDNVSGKTVRACSESLAPVYTRLFQRSFDEGHIPRTWKTSIIIPVPKKRSPSQLNDYRPVALTSIAFKCVEKVILKHLRSETAKYQDPLQFAYCQNRNTEDAILTLLHKLYEHLDKPKTYTRVLFVDFPSAFNTIQPHLLIEKLLAMAVNPTIISWLYSFLFPCLSDFQAE
jgi:hypothetical protein